MSHCSAVRKAAEDRVQRVYYTVLYCSVMLLSSVEKPPPYCCRSIMAAAQQGQQSKARTRKDLKETSRQETLETGDTEEVCEILQLLENRESTAEGLGAAVRLSEHASEIKSVDFDEFMVIPITNYVKETLDNIGQLDLCPEGRNHGLCVVMRLLDITEKLVKSAPQYSTLMGMVSMKDKFLTCVSVLCAPQEVMERATAIIQVTHKL